MKEFLRNLAAKLRTKSFWATLLGALTLLLSEVCGADASAAAEQIAQATGGILMLLGIVASPAPVEKNAQSKENETDENVADKDQTQE